jgi:hypothetical protein
MVGRHHNIHYRFLPVFVAEENLLGVFDPVLHLRCWVQLIRDKFICCHRVARAMPGQESLAWCSWCHESAVQHWQVLF